MHSETEFHYEYETTFTTDQGCFRHHQPTTFLRDETSFKNKFNKTGRKQLMLGHTSHWGLQRNAVETDYIF